MLAQVKKFSINKTQQLVYESIRRPIDSVRVLNGTLLMNYNISRSSGNESLSDYAVSVFSQFGEDGIFDYLCESLKIVSPGIVELGAGEFEECNSRFIARRRLAKVCLSPQRTRIYVRRNQ